MKKTDVKISMIIVCLILILCRAESQTTRLNTFGQGNSGPAENISQKDGTPAGRHILEVAHGQAFVDWTDAWAWMFCTNYLYRLQKNVALGGGLGLQFDWTGIYPVISTNIILGKKSDSFAAGIDIKYMFTELIDEGSNFWVTTGIYYKNFFVKAMPTFIFGFPEEWYFETGYSFTLNNK